MKIRNYEAADHSQVVSLWKAAFPNSTGHNDPGQSIDRKVATNDGFFCRRKRRHCRDDTRRIRRSSRLALHGRSGCRPAAYRYRFATDSPCGAGADPTRVPETELAGSCRQRCGRRVLRVTRFSHGRANQHGKTHMRLIFRRSIKDSTRR